MLLKGDYVEVIVPKGALDVETEFYLSMHAGKTGEITDILPHDVCAVQLEGVDRVTYFYTHELRKVTRTETKKRKRAVTRRE